MSVDKRPRADHDCGHAYAANWRERATQAEARVQELEAETARYDEMRQGYMDRRNAEVQELEREVATLTAALEVSRRQYRPIY